MLSRQSAVHLLPSGAVPPRCSHLCAPRALPTGGAGILSTSVSCSWHGVARALLRVLLNIMRISVERDVKTPLLLAEFALLGEVKRRAKHLCRLNDNRVVDLYHRQRPARVITIMIISRATSREEFMRSAEEGEAVNVAAGCLR